MWYYICCFLIAYFLSCVLLAVLHMVLEKKKVENVKDEQFDKCFLIIITIFIAICMIYFKVIN